MAAVRGDTKAYLVGGGIANLASAVVLVRDGGVPGESIHIFEEKPVPGGSLDAVGSPSEGYLMRGGRMFEEHFVCTYDVLDSIPSPDAPDKSIKEDLFEFFKEYTWHATSRLIDRGAVVDSSRMGLSTHDQLALAQLMMLGEDELGGKRIDQCFLPAFFTTNFWYMWCTVFAFEPWHSAIEMRRYLMRFIHLMPAMSTMEDIFHTRYNQYDSIVRPVMGWLAERGVRFHGGVRVTDLDFAPVGVAVGGGYRVERIHLSRDGASEEIAVGERDVVIVTNGSMTSNSTFGSMTSPAALDRGAPEGSWALWRRLAEGRPVFGNPAAFSSDIDRSKWMSFTVTTRSPLFRKLMEDYTHSELGRAGLMTFKDSGWLMTINLHHNPEFPDQPENVDIWWGYGLYPDRAGDFVHKPMAECTGEELLVEVFSQLRMTEHLPELIRDSTCVPCMMPYITSHFMPRAKGDRPEVVPVGSTNLAFVGQFCEMPDDTVFTVEYSVRSAMVAVYTLLGIDRPVPALYRGYRDVNVLLNAVKTVIR